MTKRDASDAPGADLALGATRLSGSGESVAASSRPAPDRYRVIRQLGAGAMGVVWEAEDVKLHRRVALKWVTPKASGDSEYRARLFREARAMAQLHHPNVVAVHDVGELGDELYLALELIVGMTAREWLDGRGSPPAVGGAEGRRGVIDAKRRTPEEGLAVWKQAAQGLAAVHKAGLVHRDVKPENVFVADDGRVVVGDFGLATGDLGETVMALTVSGAVIGTPLYMSAEQLSGESATPAADQFALCVCMWEAIAGRRPYEAPTMAGLALAMLKPLPLPAHGDRRIFAVLKRGLSPDPAERWPDIPTLLAALEPPVEKRRGGMLAVAVALAVGAGGAIGWQQLTKPSPPVAAPQPPAASAEPPAAIPPPPAAAGSPQPQPPAAAVPPQPSAGSGSPHPHYDAAASALASRDASTCLRELDAGNLLDRTHPDDAAFTRASCTMLGGDCVGGHAILATYKQDHHQPQADFDRVRIDLDARYCELDAPPLASQPSRAAKRLEALAYARQSCAPVLDFIAAHHIVLPPNPARANQLVFCAVADGNCADARKQFHANVPQGIATTPAQDQQTDNSFDLSFPSCAGK